MKEKIVSDDQACRRCGGSVVRQQHPEGWQPKPNQAYWFEWWFRCTKCGTLYMVEAAKRFADPNLTPKAPTLWD